MDNPIGRNFPAVMLTAAAGKPMNRSELKQGAGEWFVLGILLFLGLLLIVLHVLHR
jgi:hypothetical protein